MSNKNKFDFDDEGDFRDIPEEIKNKSIDPNPVRPIEADEFIESEEVDSTVDDDLDSSDDFQEEEPEEDFSVVLSDARLRLEQGRLYEMIMNHNLFDNLDADPKAVKNVQGEIRSYARERMEIMLGMRQETVKNAELGVDLPFNSLEVEALKALASAATQGASKNPNVEKYVAPVERKQGGLNTISSSAPQKPASMRRPLPSKPAAPVKRLKVDPNLEARLRAEGVEQQYIDEAKRQVSQEKFKPMKKSAYDMSKEELAERNRQAVARTHRQVRSANALPMATPEQMEALAMARAAEASAHPSMVRIMDLLNAPTRK